MFFTWQEVSTMLLKAPRRFLTPSGRYWAHTHDAVYRPMFHHILNLPEDPLQVGVKFISTQSALRFLFGRTRQHERWMLDPRCASPAQFIELYATFVTFFYASQAYAEGGSANVEPIRAESSPICELVGELTGNHARSFDFFARLEDEESFPQMHRMLSTLTVIIDDILRLPLHIGRSFALRIMTLQTHTENLQKYRLLMDVLHDHSLVLKVIHNKSF